MEFIDVKRFSAYVRGIYHSEYITSTFLMWITRLYLSHFVTGSRWWCLPWSNLCSAWPFYSWQLPFALVHLLTMWIRKTYMLPSFVYIHRFHMNSCLSAWRHKALVLISSHGCVSSIPTYPAVCLLMATYKIPFQYIEVFVRDVAYPLYSMYFRSTFAVRVKCHRGISGVPLPGSQEESEISQYTHDNSMFCQNYASIYHVFKVLDQFFCASSASLNKEKCKGLWLGARKGNTDQLCGISWSSSVDCRCVHW